MTILSYSKWHLVFLDCFHPKLHIVPSPKQQLALVLCRYNVSDLYIDYYIVLHFSSKASDLHLMLN